MNEVPPQPDRDFELKRINDPVPGSVPTTEFVKKTLSKKDRRKQNHTDRPKQVRIEPRQSWLDWVRGFF